MNLSPFIQALQNPLFYPHSVDDPISLIQTHCSMVFLTGNYAYKIKKNVNFGFLDYSTLEKRHYFLTQELVMNREIAPDIYLEVLPVSLINNQFILGQEVNIVEYVLKMAQFPQDCLLISLFEADQLKPKYLQELGVKVAEFHRKAKVNDYIESFGEIPVIKQSIDDNYTSTEKYIGIAQTQEQYQQTRQFTEQFLTEKKALFEQRVINHKIRECHGDLHLKNICYWQNKIQLFDRIEFNEPFRYVDVMYDIAFTVMDLDARNRRDLSNLFLNTYLEQTGDWEGLPILPFYLSRQAYVRAKVTSMLLDDPDISDAAKQEAIAVARDYYKLAWRYTQKNQGQLILMSGLSGSGKSTVANYWATQLNGIQIRSDAVRKQLAGIALSVKGDSSLYQPEMNVKTYNRLAELGLLLASHGFTVLLDAKYDRLIWRNTILDLAQTNNIPLKIVYCRADGETLRDRLLKRTGDISDATVDLLAQQQNQAESFSDQELNYVISVNTQTEDWRSPLNAIFSNY